MFFCVSDDGYIIVIFYGENVSFPLWNIFGKKHWMGNRRREKKETFSFVTVALTIFYVRDFLLFYHRPYVD